jgi:hypothetical protein
MPFALRERSTGKAEQYRDLMSVLRERAAFTARQKSLLGFADDRRETGEPISRGCLERPFRFKEARQFLGGLIALGQKDRCLQLRSIWQLPRARFGQLFLRVVLPAKQNRIRCSTSKIIEHPSSQHAA